METRSILGNANREGGGGRGTEYSIINRLKMPTTEGVHPKLLEKTIT